MSREQKWHFYDGIIDRTCFYTTTRYTNYHGDCCVGCRVVLCDCGRASALAERLGLNVYPYRAQLHEHKRNSEFDIGD